MKRLSLADGVGLPPGKRQDGFELGQPEVQLRIRPVSGIFKEVGQVKAGQVEKRWREDRAEDNCPASWINRIIVPKSI